MLIAGRGIEGIGLGTGGVQAARSRPVPAVVELTPVADKSGGAG